jgi:hypothetical protein
VQRQKPSGEGEIPQKVEGENIRLLRSGEQRTAEGAMKWVELQVENYRAALRVISVVWE